MNTYDVEITDMYGGEANYSWVDRFTVRANTFRGAVNAASKLGNISWRKVAVYGGTHQYLSKSGLTTMFIRHEELVELL